jgi:predicted Rossmann fold nucleotide-binding protein DprA/Smf involved in DNA uptake
VRQDDALAAILLTSRLASEGLKPLKASEFWPLCEQIGRPGVVLGETEHDLVRRHGLSDELAARMVGLLDRATVMAFELDRLDQSGISTLTPFDEHYPSRFVARLGAKAPPLLYTAGALELLDQPGTGVVGRRDVSPDGGAVATELGDRAAMAGRPLVSGGARGVDQLAMDAALAAGGTVIGIVADSLTRAVRRPEVRRAVHARTTVMATPYRPDAPFTAANALGRNKLVYAQSLVTIVVAADVDQGGTWSGAVEALAETFGRVAVWRGRGEGAGNEALQERGAAPITSVDDLDALLAGPEPSPSTSDGGGPAVPPSSFER